VKKTEVTCEPEALSAFAGTLPGKVAIIGLEAGLDVVLMESRQVKGALKAMPIETDRRDAEGIARLLHIGWFRPVHCKSLYVQDVRALLDARKAIQQGMIALKMSLRGLLRNFGPKVGGISRGRYDAGASMGGRKCYAAGRNHTCVEVSRCIARGVGQSGTLGSRTCEG
jgi:transposase